MTCYTVDARAIAQGFAELAARSGATWRWFDQDRNIVELTINDKMYFFDVIETPPLDQGGEDDPEVTEWLADPVVEVDNLPFPTPGLPEPVEHEPPETETEQYGDLVLLFGEEKAREIWADRISRGAFR